MGCMTNFDNLIWNLKTIPTMIELDYKSHKAIRDPEYLKKKREKQNKGTKETEKVVVNESKSSEEVVNESKTEEVKNNNQEPVNTTTEKDNSKIRRIESSRNKTDFTDKLVQYALLYMTNEHVQLLPDYIQIEKEIINGVAALFEFGKIYKNAAVSSLVVYDPDCKDDYISTSKYLLSIKDILAWKNDPIFMEKLESRKNRLFGIKQNQKNVNNTTGNNAETKKDNSKIRRIESSKNKTDFTDKLVQYALFYMSNEYAQLSNHIQVEKEFINGVAALFEFGKIYKDADVSILAIYDPDKEDYLPTSKYLLSIKDILAWKNDPIFMEKLESRKNRLFGIKQNQKNVEKEEIELKEEKPEEAEENNKSTNSWGVKNENGFIRPIFISKEPIYLNEDGPVNIQGIGISDELFNRLELELGSILSTKKHRYEMDGDLVKLYVTKGAGIEEFYTIDPGVVMGLGRFCIIGRILNDQIFVPFECKEIVERIIEHSFYILTQDEVNTVLSYYFKNMGIYRYIDMSNTETLINLSKQELDELENKLTFVIQKLAETNQIPRLRFNKFNSLNDFELVSDNNVKSPLAYSGETCSVIIDGLSFQIKDKKIVQNFNNIKTETNC